MSKERQCQIVALRRQGMTYKQIKETLGLKSVSQVQHYLKREEEESFWRAYYTGGEPEKLRYYQPIVMIEVGKQ